LLLIKGAPSTEWGPLILKAADAKARLAPDDRARVDALAMFSDGRGDNRCDALRKLVSKPDQTRAQDFVSAIALADCIRSDRRVIRDPSTNSSYAFASSFQEAADLYSGVIARNAGSGAAYEILIPRLEQVLWTTKNRVRAGILAESTMATTTFIAMPELIADTLAFVPFALGSGSAGQPEPSRLDRAIESNLERLQSYATSWGRAVPADPTARETLARILEARGQLDGSQASALSSFHAARLALEKSSSEPDYYFRKLNLATGNVRILVKLGKFDAAAALADTALGWNAVASADDSINARIQDMQTGLLALTGHVGRVVAIDQAAAGEDEVMLPTGEARKLNAELGADKERLGDYAAFGLPRDSVTMVANRIWNRLESLVRPSELAAFRAAVLRRPLSNAVNVTGTYMLAQLGPSTDLFSNAVAALDRGDKRTATRIADSLDAYRAGSAPGEITMDAVFQQAWLRTAVGDSSKAARFIDRALGGLSRAPQSLLKGPIIPAALVRVMLLRADLADAAGDVNVAQRWRGAARSLWGRGDPEVQAALTNASSAK